MAIQSGLYDVALAIGIEKLSTPRKEQFIDMQSFVSKDVPESWGYSQFGIFSLAATRHMALYGTTREQIAQVSVKNHQLSILNPKYAQYTKELTLEEILGSRPIAYNLRLLECCPLGDGCAVAILASKEAAKRFSGIPIYIAASESSALGLENVALCELEKFRKLSRRAYEKAGIGPEDIDLAEVHDCFAIAEIIWTETLGFCPEGQGGPTLERGETTLGGRIPVNVSGGLLAKGHPFGATGIAQIVEIVEQLRNRAGKRQVEGAKVGLTLNAGSASFIHILKR